MAAATTAIGFQRFRRFDLVAPSLLWIETTSALHAAMWRGALSRTQAELMRDRIVVAPIRLVDRAELNVEAWELADEFGWAKTYDANYVGLARLLHARVVTLDARLRRGAGRTGLVVGPNEL